MRTTIARSYLKKFNIITHIGVVISRENSSNGDDAVGKIYAINNNGQVS
jgi:hypothetical protein